MKRISIVLNSFLPIVPYLIVFISSLYFPSDPDLGWHLKYGQYFWQHGKLLRDNTFSTMMPQYHWANTSWLTDIISYSAYHLGGFLGLILLSAVVVTATFYFFAKAFRFTLWEQTLIFPWILYLESPVNVISFRGQQLAIMFAGVLFYLISLYKNRPKLLWLAIPLFLIWVDVDGEFLLGYALFCLWVILYIATIIVQRVLFGEKDAKKAKKREITVILKKINQTFIEKRKEVGTLLLILLCSLVATFINPFGYGLHLDAISHIGNPLLKDIGEYLPFGMYTISWWNEVVIGIILIFGLFILCFRGKFLQLLPSLGGGLLLFLLSLGDRRFAWPSYYLLFPLLAMAATFLKPDKKKITRTATIIILIFLLVITIWRRYPFIQYTKFDWNDYCQLQSLPCSSQSAEFLIEHRLNHSLFSLYGWGGWLIWNYPQIKPTIDGRMHLWVQNGYSGFADYYSIEQNLKDIDSTDYDVVYMSSQKPVYNRLLQLVRQGKWNLVYQDRDAGIFVRKDK